MTGPERKLTGLKAHAEATLLADLRVTPELKAKLMRRIEAVEGRPLPLRKSPWTWRSTAAAVAACAVVAIAVTGRMMPGLEQATRGGSGEDAAMEAPVPAPVEPPQPAADAYGAAKRVEVSPTIVVGSLQDREYTTTTAYSLQVSDANGNIVLKNQNGTVTAPAPGPAIPGVEADPGRKIVLNAEYDLQVTDAPGAMQQLQALATGNGGYVVDAALNKGGDGSWAGRATLRIPSARYTGAVHQIRTVGDIRSERQWSQDVTERYMDLEARIKIQQEYERKLQELAAKAATFDDWMKLTQQVNETRARIESMQGSIKLLANQVEFSTINVTLRQPAPGQPTEPKPQANQGLMQQMRWAFTESVRVLGNLGRDFMVGLAAMTPFLVPLAILGLLVFLYLRSRKNPQ